MARARSRALGELIPPTTSGTGRLATEDDVDLLVAWRSAFAVEAHGHDRSADEGAATDLANPVSNSIYQKIGYRPVYDSTEIEFSRLPSTS